MSTQLATRRALLKGGLAAGAAIVLGGLGAAGAGLYLPPPSDIHRVLSETEADIVRAVGVTLFPPGVFPIAGDDDAVVAEVDRILDDGIPALHARGVRYLLKTIEWGTLAGHGSRFTRLDPDARREVLEIWATPEVLLRRISMDGLKMVFGMAYFKQRAVLDQVEWRNMCSGSLT